MPAYEARIARLEDLLGAELERHDTGRSLESLRAYRDDPVGFTTDVLQAELWSAQEGILVAVRDHPLTVVRSGNACGKDFAAARLALWWAYARGGLVLLTGPTQRQITEVLFGEIARAFRAGNLPGTLGANWLKLPGTDRNQILGFTTDAISKLGGWHWPQGLLIIVTEAQGVEAELYDAMLGCLSGASDRLLALGNPLFASGKFYEISRPGSSWKKLRISSLDHPNVVSSEERIKGAVTREQVARLERESGGTSSDLYVSRVLAEFPTSASANALLSPAWIERAVLLHESGALRESMEGLPVIVGFDPALGVDAAVACVRQGNVVHRFEVFRADDTMQLVGKLLGLLRECRVAPTMDLPVTFDGFGAVDGQIVVDRIGLGDGVFARLKEQRYVTMGFDSRSKPIGRSASRFMNRRAEAFWDLRDKFERGKLAIPPDERLLEELTALRFDVQSTGKVQIVSKPELRAELGRSPDRADALMLAFAQGSTYSGLGFSASW